MWKHTSITALLCVISMISLSNCQNKEANENQLNRADALLVSNPDSALLLLDQIARPNELPLPEKTFYGLLLSGARYQTQQPQTDTMLQQAIKYYEANQSTYRLAQAYFFMGGVQASTNNPNLAQTNYLKAYRCAEQANEPNLLGHIASNLGDLYMQERIYDLACEYLQKAHHWHTQTANKQKQYETMLQLGRLYAITNSHTPDSAIEWYTKAIETAPLPVAFEACGELGNLYTLKGLHDSAYYYIQIGITHAPNVAATYPFYVFYGDLLLQQDSLNSARYYLEQATQSANQDTRASAYYKLALIDHAEHRYKEGLTHYLTYEKISNQLATDRGSNTLSGVRQAYNWQQTEQLKNHMQVAQARRESFILLLSFVIVCLLLTFTYYRYQKERELREQKERVVMWQEEHDKAIDRQRKTDEAMIQELENQLLSLRKNEAELLRLQKEKLHLQNQQMVHSATDIQFMLEQMSHDPIFQRFHQREMRPNETDWGELAKLLNRKYDEFNHRLIGLCPKITEEELRTCDLLKIGLSPAEIARILTLTKQTISMRRKRLYEKIFNEPGTPDQLDDFIRQF